mmetsp:Transcript_13007/g.40395  ORF Transcript_13007/g.40395 Transcript_13007/m.40395 type:complete len:351 (-) Transcript_13007:355-1407(-)
MKASGTSSGRMTASFRSRFASPLPATSSHCTPGDVSSRSRSTCCTNGSSAAAAAPLPAAVGRWPGPRFAVVVPKVVPVVRRARAGVLGGGAPWDDGKSRPWFALSSTAMTVSSVAVQRALAAHTQFQPPIRLAGAGSDTCWCCENALPSTSHVWSVSDAGADREPVAAKVTATGTGEPVFTLLRAAKPRESSSGSRTTRASARADAEPRGSTRSTTATVASTRGASALSSFVQVRSSPAALPPADAPRETPRKSVAGAAIPTAPDGACRYPLTVTPATPSPPTALTTPQASPLVPLDGSVNSNASLLVCTGSPRSTAHCCAAPSRAWPRGRAALARRVAGSEFARPAAVR